MSDFDITLESKLDLSDAETKIENFINTYSNKPLNIKVEFDPKSINTSNFGKQIQNQLNSSVSSVKFTGDTFYKQYFDQAKKDVDEAKRIEKVFKNSISSVDASDINKNAIKAVNARKSAETKAQKEILTQQKQQQKEIDAIENARIKSIENTSKRETKIVQQQNSAINKALEDRYKQQQKEIKLQEVNRQKQIELQNANKQKALLYTKSASSKLTSAIDKYSYGDSTEAKKLSQKLNRGVSNFGDLSNIDGTIAKLDSEVNSVISTLKKSHDTSLNALNQEINAELKLQSQKDSFYKRNIGNIDLEIQRREESSKIFSAQLKAQMEEEQKWQDYTSKIELSLTNGKYDAKSSIMKSQLSAYRNQDTELLRTARQQVELYNNTISNLKKHFDSNDTFTMNDEEIVSSLNNMTNAAEKFENTMTQIRNTAVKPFSQLDATTASNKTLTWLKNNSRAAKEYGDALKDLAEKQRTATSTEDLKKYTKEVNDIKSLAASKGLTGTSPIAELKRAGKQIFEFTTIYGTLQRIPQLINNMTTQVINVDDAITNLRMATSISNEEALNLMSTYSKLGNELKATSVDVAASATEWLKQGKSIQEAQNLAKDAIVLSKIGGLSSEESTKTITAAMKSYNMAESEVMGFVDKISAIDLVSATDVGGLSQAFNEVAANAKNAGVEAEKLLSYAAVIGETSQEGMASVGTSLNAIFSRMGNIKLSRLKDYETGEDLSNVETVLRGVGIQLRDSQDQFREFDDVLDDTANKWSSFSSVQQRAVASAFAGTHHMNSFLILMQNWNKVQEYTKTANEASGQSMEKFAAYQESATGKIEGFKNAFQSLSTTAIDSDLFKGAIDSGTGLLNILTQIIDVGGGIPIVLGAIGGTAFIKNLDWIY